MWMLWLLACGAPTLEERFQMGNEAAASGDMGAAALAWGQACDEGHVVSCAAAGGLSAASAQDRLRWNTAACEAREVLACRRLAHELGGAWWGRACEAGDGPSCAHAAGEAKRPRERARWLAQACHGEVLSACVQAAVAWKALGERSRAAALLEVRCEAEPGHVACAHAQYLRRVIQARARCVGGETEACRWACAEGLDPDSCEGAWAGLVEACEGADPQACTLQAVVLARGLRGPPEPQRIHRLLWRACDEVRQEHPRTAPTDPWACLMLADRVEAGLGSLPEAARGDVSWLRNQGCDLQLDYACAGAL